MAVRRIALIFVACLVIAFLAYGNYQRNIASKSVSRVEESVVEEVSVAEP